ncbi:MAG: hypothetical protein ACFFFK_05450, partial [Candidatus Thorarchaeota archaeon]
MRNGLSILVDSMLLVLILISSITLNPTSMVVHLEDADMPPIEEPFTLSQQGILQNQTFKQEVLSFVQNTQDDGEVAVPSMDMAYYIGMSLFYLNSFGFGPPADLVTQILDFVGLSRNDDGGYANWEGARSSVESTFQALQLLVAYNNLSALPINSVNQTANFLNLMKTLDNGYFPLPEWDAPDVSSTYRVINIMNQINARFPSLGIQIDNTSSSFINSAFVPPIFANGASGFSENLGGPAELLASLNAIQAYLLMNITDTPYFESVAKFIASLTTINGGVAGYLGGLPTMGFTSAALYLYLLSVESSTRRASFRVLSLVSVVALILAHHLTAFMMAVYLLVAILMQR